MQIKKFVILLYTLVLFCVVASGQETSVKKDTARLYKNIETISKRNRFNTFLYKLIFKPIAIVSNKVTSKKVYKKLAQKPYSTFQGKIIRKINIITLDPFGFSARDTTTISQSWLTKSGNSLHIKTQLIAIRNLLLIKENEPFNSFFVKESERLIRSQKFVHDVNFYVTSSDPKSDSVDIYIRELDIWSINGGASVSTSQMSIGISDKNFLGSGHEFQNVFSRNITTGISTFNTNYFVPNIKTSYINSQLHLGIDGYGNTIKTLAFERPFYSPYTRWAAGIAFTARVKKDSLTNLSPLYFPLNYKLRSQDFWIANAIQIFRGSTEEDLATNLIFAFRYLRVRYYEKPTYTIDPLHIYSSEDFYLAAIGISTRKYVRDTYIFKYGTIEDVPVGKALELTGGYQLRTNSWRPYLGVRFSIGNYHEWGYLSTNIDFGTFFRNSNPEQGAITAGINYFTGLIEVRRWKFRQFVKPRVMIGLNRFSYDTLTINENYGLDGFNSLGLSGTRRILFTLQTQSYAPWNFIGFRFGPFLTYSLGMLGNASTGFKNSKVYSQIGLGILIKNENLILNTFQISIAFYPSIPGRGQNVLKANSFRTTDFGFRDFEIGKPGIVAFQ